MAEGFKPIPHNEADMQLPRPELPTRRRMIAGAFEALGLRMAASRERKARLKDDEDEEKLSHREGRFVRILNRIFSRTVDREHIEPSPNEMEHTSLFFSIGGDAEPAHVDTGIAAPANSVEGPLYVPETPTVIEAPLLSEAEPDTVETSVDDAVRIDSVLLVEADMPAETATVEVEPAVPQVPEVLPAEDRYSPEVVYVNHDRTPETAIVLGAYEHHRVAKLNREVAHLQDETKQLDKRLGEAGRANKSLKREAIAEHPKRVMTERPLEQRIDQPKPARQEATPVRSTPEKIPDRRPISREQAPERRAEPVTRFTGEISEERKQSIVEKILTAPERFTVAGAEEHKDIAYELSHEHKDLDKQAVAHWAALQAAADVNAKANALALATASTQIPTADPGTALKKAEDQKALEQKDTYKKAATSGIITAIVLIAIYLIILLIMKRK